MSTDVLSDSMVKKDTPYLLETSPTLRRGT